AAAGDHHREREVLLERDGRGARDERRALGIEERDLHRDVALGDAREIGDARAGDVLVRRLGRRVVLAVRGVDPGGDGADPGRGLEIRAEADAEGESAARARGRADRRGAGEHARAEHAAGRDPGKHGSAYHHWGTVFTSNTSHAGVWLLCPGSCEVTYRA